MHLYNPNQLELLIPEELSSENQVWKREKWKFAKLRFGEWLIEPLAGILFEHGGLSGGTGAAHGGGIVAKTEWKCPKLEV